MCVGVADFDKEWDREIIGKIIWKDTTEDVPEEASSCQNILGVCFCRSSSGIQSFAKLPSLDCFIDQEKKHFHSWQPWIGLPIGWQDGYLEFRDVGASEVPLHTQLVLALRKLDVRSVSSCVCVCVCVLA